MEKLITDPVYCIGKNGMFIERFLIDNQIFLIDFNKDHKFSIITMSPTPECNLFQQLKGQSTIYRRHEERMRKSYQKRSDPRSAPIRVLSGLPGIKYLFDSYQEKDEKDIIGNVRNNIKTQKIEDANDLNVVAFSDNDENVFIPFRGELKTIENEKEYNPERIKNLPYTFISGCAGGTLEAIFGRSRNDVLSRVTRQVALLAGNVKSHSNSLFCYSQSTLQYAGTFYFTSVESATQPIERSYPKLQSLAHERIVASALAGGLLFTSNAYFRSKFSALEEFSHDYHPFSLSFISASAATGIVTGTVFAPFELSRSRVILKQCSSIAYTSPFRRNHEIGSSPSGRAILSEMKSVIQRHGLAALYKGGSEVYSREIVGNIAYFGMYELMKSYLSGGSSNELSFQKGRFSSHHPYQQATASQIVLSGGAAGMAYWAIIYPLDTLKVMLQAQSLTNPRFLTAVAAVKEIGFTNLYRGYSSCVFRAAPANAALFFGYETALSMFSEGISS